LTYKFGLSIDEMEFQSFDILATRISIGSSVILQLFSIFKLQGVPENMIKIDPTIVFLDYRESQRT